jgi:hypothetical protein
LRHTVVLAVTAGTKVVTVGGVDKSWQLRVLPSALLERGGCNEGIRGNEEVLRITTETLRPYLNTGSCIPVQLTSIYAIGRGHVVIIFRDAVRQRSYIYHVIGVSVDLGIHVVPSSGYQFPHKTSFSYITGRTEDSQHISSLAVDPFAER